MNDPREVEIAKLVQELKDQLDKLDKYDQAVKKADYYRLDFENCYYVYRSIGVGFFGFQRSEGQLLCTQYGMLQHDNRYKKFIPSEQELRLMRDAEIQAEALVNSGGRLETIRDYEK